MEEKKIIYKSTVDEGKNPFSIPSWHDEHSARNPERLGREMQPALIFFRTIMD